MRLFLATLALLLALPASADVTERVEQAIKDAIHREMEKRVPRGDVPLVLDGLPRGEVKYNLTWRVTGRAGPLYYRDDWGDHEAGSVQLRLGGMKKFNIEIRKDFW